MQLEYRTPYMAPDPVVVFEGLEEVLQKDLEKHTSILERTQKELSAYRDARSHEVKKKAHYEKLISEGKYNEKAMQNALTQIDINIRHLSDKVKLSNEKIEHHTLIVEKLTEELERQYKNLKLLKEHESGLAN